jgi:hypothetical protein
MKRPFVLASLTLALAAPSLASASAGDVPDGCSAPLDFRLVGTWAAVDGGDERKDFVPSETLVRTSDGRATSIEDCMSGDDDVREVALTEVAPHVLAMRETHYRVGFVGLDRLLVTFPSGVVRFFARVVALPGHLARR